MEFSVYMGILFGCSVVIFIFETCFYLSLPNKIIAEGAERLFEINRLDHNKYVVDFFGIRIHLKSSRRFRISIAMQLTFIAWINILIFINGCVIEVQSLLSSETCPPQANDCFRLGKMMSHERIICQPGEIISNSSNFNVMCFALVYSEQNAMSILNQIGICSSVFSLLCHTFRITCQLSRRRWGLVCFSIIALGLIVVTILPFIIEMNFSLAGRLIVTGSMCLLINVIQLAQFTHSYQNMQSSPDSANTYKFNDEVVKDQNLSIRV